MFFMLLYTIGKIFKAELDINVFAILCILELMSLDFIAALLLAAFLCGN